ncbi:MAG: nucleotide exchange factor GrpE [Gammaproteobacteria bacterium]|nr:nucleotide exchange factor GrpE [Gammaproteobacteria bacterium]
MSDKEKVTTSPETGDAPEHTEDAAPGAQAGSETGPDEMQALLEDARNKADEHWNQCIRLQAELDNLRKRAERDVANAHKFALEKFANDLLPVRDSLEMGIAAAGEGNEVDPVKLREGSELTLKMLADTMARFGIQEIDPQGQKFNPEYHEAMSMQERSDVEPNTVVTVIQKGYTLNDRLIRPAMVMVSRAPAQDSPQIDERA